MSKVTIKSKGERFRRAGIEFTRAGVEVDSADLTPEQMLAIASEPQLSFFVDGKQVDRPGAEELAAMREEIDQRAAEKVAAEEQSADGKKSTSGKKAAKA
jgi:hypothetical protein